MDFSNFSGAFTWIIQHGYFLMFVIMLIEGPVITAAAAFAVALGYFDGWVVFSLSIVGNLLPDVIYYAVGYWGREKLVNRYAHYFGLPQDRIIYLENLSRRHAGKAMTLIKLVPLLATPGLIIAGAVKMPLKKYINWCVILTVPSSLFFYLLGFYFGAAYDKINHYLNLSGLALILILIFFALISYGYGKLTARFARKIDKT
ncbi:MAG: VTT domain-containing protein [Candidatus Moranbacteria bacterium]|nr:VTT domain-containing protein [Candidatus Moranbacteria bacterium]